MIDVCTIGDLQWAIILPISHMPSYGEMMLITDIKRFLGNDAAIVSLLTSRLGMRCRILPTNAIACHDGQPLIDLLKREGVDVSWVNTAGSITPITFFLAKIGSDKRVGMIEEIAFDCASAPEWPPNCHFAYFDLYEENLKNRLALLHEWSQTHVRCLINLSATHIEEKVSLLTHVSPLDTIQLRGNGTVNDARVWGQSVFRKCHAKAVIITLGSVGTVLVEQYDTHFIEAQPIRPLRTIGAGASFSAGFLSALAKGATYREAVTFASDYAAAFCVSDKNPCEVHINKIENH